MIGGATTELGEIETIGDSIERLELEFPEEGWMNLDLKTKLPKEIVFRGVLR